MLGIRYVLIISLISQYFVLKFCFQTELQRNKSLEYFGNSGKYRLGICFAILFNWILSRWFKFNHSAVNCTLGVIGLHLVRMMLEKLHTFKWNGIIYRHIDKSDEHDSYNISRTICIGIYFALGWFRMVILNHFVESCGLLTLIFVE